ncbi:hypothetical protein WCE41_10925 [Luteimonas sp. MJ246]|uniref:hypothetical protein n=1 Tax=Luteimonas sp. MJ174 TaxID=3129237 RepID=UPI0031BACB57
MNDPRHDEFDRRMRALHAHAVEQLPSRTTWQLRVRRDAAARATPARHPGRGWWMAAASAATAAAFALAIGLAPPDPVPAGDGAPSLAAATEAVQAASYDESLAALDEDPDLYLWLAAQDSLILAME